MKLTTMRFSKSKSPKKLVLLVDDANVMCRLVSSILGNEYDVQACRSAVEAIQWLADSKKIPDVVVSDIAMSGMSGIEFGQFLSINSLYGEIPLIYMSGKSEDELRSELNSVKYSGYTQKPFNPDHLLSTIAEVTN